MLADGPDPVLDPNAAIAWLEGAGYRVSWRLDGFHDCLLTRGTERWLGRGGTRDEAAADAVRQAFPSAAARALLAIAMGVDAGARDQAPEAAAAAPAEMPDSVAPPEPVAEAALEPEAAPQEPPPPPPPPPAAPGPVRRRPEPMTVEEALEELTLLRESIEAQTAEAALMAPDRQRLLLLAWVCRARHLEAAVGGDEAVATPVGAVVHDAAVLSRRWWPGAVSALRRDATPSDVGRELGLEAAARPQTWGEAAAEAERRFADLESQGERQGLDEYGWADGPYLAPAPLAPDQRLVDLARAVEEAARAIPEPSKRAAPEPDPAQLRQWEAWARLVRWLRGHVTDFERWGDAAGHLRRMAQRSKGAASVVRLLDPTTKPRQPWAAELGEDPRAKLRKTERRRVLRAAPGPGPVGAEALSAWLGEALEVLDDERIAALLGPHKAAFAMLNPEVPPPGVKQRRWKRRLAKLSTLVAGADPTAPPPPMEEEPEPAAAPPVEAPADALLTEVVHHTRGRSALFIGNRKDPALQEELRSTFGFAQLDWSEGGNRRLQDLRDRVAGGTYHYVLGATGFQSHSMDAQMVKACRKAGALYVRVHRGRRLACTLALARELGVRNEAA